MAATTQTTKPEMVPVTSAEPGTGFYDYWTDIRNRIEVHAYQIFEGRGRVHGHDIDDWLQSESQILKPVHVAMTEVEHLYTITVDVSGFDSHELDVRVEPFRIFITGRKRVSGDALPAEIPEEIFKPIDLAHEIETNTVIAELVDGVLTISMRKAFVPTAVKHVKADSNGLRSRSAQLRKRADIAKRYAAAAKDQLRRATAKEKNVRARAVGGQRRAKAASENATRQTHPLVPWTEEAPHSSLE